MTYMKTMLLFFLFFLENRISAQTGYLVLFNGEYNKDSVVVKKHRKILLQERLTTGFENEVDSTVVFIKGQKANRIIILLIDRKRKLSMKLKHIQSGKVRFVYVSFYDNNLHYSIGDKLLEGM